MHGRKRSEYKALQRDVKVAAKLSAKAEAWHQLQAALLQRRRDALANKKAESSTVTTVATLSLIEKAVTVNPDPIWLWNFRRDLLDGETAIASALVGATADTPPDATRDSALDDIKAAQGVWEREQAVTQTALTANPKAYAAWHHRKCCLQHYIVTIERSSRLDRDTTIPDTLAFELSLTASLFLRDERNFHCWSYRRFVVSCLLWHASSSSSPQGTAEHDATTTSRPNGEWKLHSPSLDTWTVWMGAQLANVPLVESLLPTGSATSVATDAALVFNAKMRQVLQDEWDFCSLKIRDNFSNCSAFHYRSKLLPLIVESYSADMALPEATPNDQSATTVESLVASELELVSNAIFTEPDDQTAWWYQHFLLDYIVKSLSLDTKANLGNVYSSMLQPHIEQLRELRQETQSQSKWVLIGLEQCLECSIRLFHTGAENVSDTDQGEVVAAINAERSEILHALMDIDADRQHRYRYLLRKL
jgi:Protein prenyltransferase alpha subunit repeat